MNRIANFAAAITALILIVFQGNVCQAGTIRELIGGQSKSKPIFVGALNSIKIAPNGKQFLIGNGTPWAEQVWDIKKKKLLWTIKDKRSVGVFSPDSRHLLTYDPFAQVTKCIVYNARTGQRLRTIQFPFSVGKPTEDVAFPVDGKSVVLLSERKYLEAEIRTGKLVKNWSYPTRNFVFRKAGLSSDAKTVGVAYDDGIRIFRSAEGKPIRKFSYSNEIPTDIGFSPDGSICWMMVTGRSFYFFRIEDSNRLPVWGFEGESLHFSPDSKYLAFPSAANLGYFWLDKDSMYPAKTFAGPKDRIFDISRDGSFAISCDNDGKIWRWRLRE